MNKMHLTSAVVAADMFLIVSASVDICIARIQIRGKTIEYNVIREKNEQKYGGNTRHKSGINGLNTPTL